MGAVVGIDLGTTNTVVAAMRDGTPAAIKDETGSPLIPSIVSFLPSGAVMVGSAALERRSDDTKNTIYSVKRLIGRPWDSSEVRQARDRFSFELKEGPGRATFVVARNETFTLPEISAFVLRKAKSIAEIELGETVDRAVVTVPANFNDLQRAATKVAGRVAGLDVMRILNEPTAAALAYGHHQGNSERIAVFDFGGGTFDITLLSLTRNVFEVLATAGNTFLGGDDLDWAIADKIATEYSAQTGQDPRSDPIVLEHLRAAAESIKIQLTTSTHVEQEIDLRHVIKTLNSTLKFAMSRTEFDQLATPIIDRTFDVCQEALGVARIEVSEIDHVLAVGGCTRIPLVRSRASEFFKRELEAHLDPHEVVAIGAALQGHALTSAATSTQVELPPVPAVTKPAELADARDDWRRKTHPFGRLGTTNVGLGQSQGVPTDGVQVPKPEGVPSRPIPNTQGIGSRGRTNTAVGMGSDAGMPLVEPVGEPRGVFETPTQSIRQPIEPPAHAAGDPLDAEGLLPVVTATGAPKQRSPAFRAAEFASNAADLSEPEDEEATIVRPPAGSVLDAELDLPEVSPVATGTPRVAARLAEGRGVATPLTKPTTPVADDVALPAISDRRADSHSRRTESPDAQNDSDLPAVSNHGVAGNSLGRTSRIPRESENKGSLKPPSADEIRQRYGDLPLIIGGRRLSSPPTDKPPPPEDLPLVRPTQDTISDAAWLPELPEEKLPAVQQRPRVPPTASPESIAQAELPIVAANSHDAADTADRLPSVSPARKAPPRAAPTRATQTTANRPSPTSSPYRLDDSDVDVVEDPKSQPPSMARTSVRPAMRIEPGEEAALPLPDLPSQDGSGKPMPAASQVPAASNRPPLRTNVSTRADLARTLEAKLDPPRSAEPAIAPVASTPLLGTKVAGLTGLGTVPLGSARAGSGVLAASPVREGARPRDGFAPLGTAQSTQLIPAKAPVPRNVRDAATPHVPSSHYGVAVPLLIDVTPLSLSVETVGTYCDVLIDRNTPVPCERSREFVTVHDGQQSVRVRVAQGESRIFSENVLLGELELTGLRPAPRGQLRISVTFGLDSDGLLHVRAIDLDTGRAAASELRLAGIPTANEIANMSSRHLASS